MDGSTKARTLARAHKHTHTHTHARSQTQTHHTHACTHTNAYTQTHTQTLTHTRPPHTHTHTHTSGCSQMKGLQTLNKTAFVPVCHRAFKAVTRRLKELSPAALSITPPQVMATIKPMMIAATALLVLAVGQTRRSTVLRPNLFSGCVCVCVCECECVCVCV